MKKTVAIQGQQASFHDIAARQFLGDDIDIISCDSFGDTFKALRDTSTEYAVVAFENSLFGSINEVYDLLLKNRYWICGEVYLRIEQCLIGLPGAKVENTKEVHSHPVALAQCEEYLDRVLPSALRFEHHDTAGSVKNIKLWNDPSKVAIAGQAAARLHNLELLAEEIETNKQNYTRFVVLSRSQKQAPGATKTSLVIGTDNKPGALYNALGVFVAHDINLSKLQSRPIIGKAWHYIFYVDVDCELNNPHLTKALQSLKDQSCEVTVLGSYKAGQK